METKNTNNTMENKFVKEQLMGEGSAVTEKGAKAYASFGTSLMNQFGLVGNYAGREYINVWSDQAKLWDENSTYAMRFIFYLRMITRSIKFTTDMETKTVQKGQGLRDEAFKRLLWVACYHPEEFYKYLYLLPVVGSWKDLFTLMIMARTDEMPVKFKLDERKIMSLIVFGLTDKTENDLIKKYLPRITSEKKCATKQSKARNGIAKDLAKLIGVSAEVYRKYKATGKAHDFQQLITRKEFDKLNFNHIPGQALLKLTSGKFFENQGLVDAYFEWLDKQDTAKFNGYAYDLAHGLFLNETSLINRKTIDKQFKQLIETATKDCGPIKGNVLCALDTSGSMSCAVNKRCIRAIDVCLSLGIYFSELNQGGFHDVVAMFDATSRLKQITGTFSEKYDEINNDVTAWGTTDFQSLITLLIDTKKNKPEIPESEYPETILVVSDMQFDDCGDKSNYELAIERLSEYFSKEYLDKLKFVWWNCAGRNENFPSNMDCGGTYVFSGFDPAIITFLLTGKEKENKERPTMEDILYSALNQEVLLLIE